MITAAGVGSGIDIESIITQLMELERQPVEVLNQRRRSLDVELSAFGRVKSGMNELASSARTLGDASLFGPFVASSSDEAVFTATATGGASSEYHDIEVLALAQSHRIATDAYASQDDAVGTGTRTFTSGENSFDVTIDASNNSLLGLRDAINDSADNTSVVASILNVDGGSRLVIAAREGGVDNEISFSGKKLQGSSKFTEITAASDAELIIDGFTVTKSTNSISDVIAGVTLDLEGLGTGVVDTQRDSESLRESLDTFVSNYNSLTSSLDQLSTAELQGDRLPRNAASSLRTVFSAPITFANGESISPLELGFTFDRNGVLSISETELSDAQAASLERFVDAFTTAETGLAAQFETVLDNFTRADGVIADREAGISTRQDTIDSQIDRMDYRLEQTEARYRRQFGAMDALVSQLQTTSNFLTSRLSGQNG